MGAGEKITLSVIKADVGGWVGHCASHPDMLALAEELVKKAVARGFLVDGQVLHASPPTRGRAGRLRYRTGVRTSRP